MKVNIVCLAGIVIAVLSLPRTLAASCPSALHSTGLEAVALSPDGMKIAAAASDGTVFSWDVKSLRQTILKDCLFVSAIAFSPDSSRVAWADGEAQISVFDLPTQRVIQSFRASANEGANMNTIGRLVFSGDGRRLSAQDFTGVRVWSLDSGKKLLTIRAELSVGQIALSHDGTLLAGSTQGLLTLWDVTRREVIRTMSLPAVESVDNLIFAHDDRWLISALSTGKITVWDTETGSKVRTLDGQTGHLELPLIVTASDSLFSAADDGSLRLWDLKTGRVISHWMTSRGFVSSNGEMLLRPGNQPGEVELWRIGSPIKGTVSFVYRSPLCDVNASATTETVIENEVKALKNIGMGKSAAADGTQLSFITYVAADCVSVSITYGEFQSPDSAEAELKRRIRKALRVVEQGPNKDLFGTTIGHRSVILLSEKNGVPTMAAVIRTEGNKYSEISSSSLGLALSVEKRQKSPD